MKSDIPSSSRNDLHTDDDARLLERIRAGEVQAEADLWEKYRRRIRLFILLKVFRRQEVADDLEQDVFIALQQAVRDGRLTEPENVGAYLYKTASNVVSRWRELARRTFPMGGQAQPPLDDNPEIVEIAREASTQLRAAVEKIRPIDKQLLILRFGEEWSYRKIALFVGMTEENARQRVCRAIARLRVRLRRVGYGR